MNTIPFGGLFRLQERAIQAAAREACRQAEDAQGFQHECRHIAAGSGAFGQRFGRRLYALCYTPSIFDAFVDGATHAIHRVLRTAQGSEVDCVANPFPHSRHILGEGRRLVGGGDRGFRAARSMALRSAAEKVRSAEEVPRCEYEGDSEGLRK